VLDDAFVFRTPPFWKREGPDITLREFFFIRYRKGERDSCDILGGSFVKREGFWWTNFLW